MLLAPMLEAGRDFGVMPAVVLQMCLQPFPTRCPFGVLWWQSVQRRNDDVVQLVYR